MRVVVVGDVEQLEAAMGRASSSVERMGASMQAAGRKLTTHMTLPLLGIAAVSAKLGVDFEASMELVHTQAGASQQEVEKLSKSVLKLAGPVATAPKTLSEGLFHLESQGLRGAKAMEALRVSAEGAKLGQANLEDVTNALGAVISSKITGVKNYEQAMGQMNATVGAGDMRMQDLADAMGTGLPAKAAIFGVSLDQVSAALAVFGDNNIRGAEAGTQLNSAMRLMGAPSKQAAKALEGVGISSRELADKLRSGGITAAIGDLRDHFKKMGLDATEQGQVLTRAFGGKQAGGVMILMDQFGRLQTKLEEVRKGGKSFADDWTAYTKTTAYHLDAAGASMKAMGVSIGDILLPVVSKLANFIGNLVAKFEGLSGSTKTAILIIGGIVAAIGPVIGVLGSLTTALAFVAANPLVILVAGIGVLVAAMVAAVVAPQKLKIALEHLGVSAHTADRIVRDLRGAFDVLLDIGKDVLTFIKKHQTLLEMLGASIGTVVVLMKAWKIATEAWTVVTKLAAAAQAAFDAILAANPIGIVVLAIAALTAAMVVLYEKNKTFRDAINETWHVIKEVATPIIHAIVAEVHTIAKVFEDVAKLVGDIVHGRWSKLWNDVKHLVIDSIKAQLTFITGMPSNFLSAAEKIGEAIVSGVIKFITHLPAQAAKEVGKALHAVRNLATEAEQFAEEVGKALVHGVIRGLESLASDLMHSAEGLMHSVVHHMKSAVGAKSPSTVSRDQVGIPLGQGVIEGIVLGLRPMPAHLKAAVRQAIEVARHAVEEARHAFTTAWGQLASAAMNAFDSVTSRHLAQMKAKFAQAKAQIESDVNEALKLLDEKQKELTPEEQIVANEQAAHDEAGRQQAITDAQAQLAAAQKGDENGKVDPQAVIDAQRALNEALYQEQLAADQRAADQSRIQKDNLIEAQKQDAEAQGKAQKAALAKKEKAQETAYKNERKAQRTHLHTQLLELEAELKKNPAAHKRIQQEIIKLLDSYGISYRNSGKALGEAFAAGLEAAVADVRRAANDIAAAAAAPLHLHSPAKEGPLSQLDKWWRPFGPMLLSGLNAQGISNELRARLAGSVRGGDGAFGLGGGARSLTPGARSGPALQVNVTVQGWVGNDTELSYKIRDELLKIGRREQNIFGGRA